MNRLALGHLDQVELRDYWSDEARDFTPWLAAAGNLALLGKAIGMDLEINSVEKGVGPFFADILCKDVARDKWVVIENQLERTDHSHLGQVLTYAAGLEAETVVWVAPRFTDEHRAALDWLNEITTENISFFGVEIELLRIGDSAPAPRFNVVCHPNDWSKAVKASAHIRELSGTGRLQLEFWTGFSAFMEGKSPIKCQKPQPQNWMNHSIGRSGMHLCSIASTWDSEANQAGHELRVQLILDGAESKEQFARLEARAQEIEAKVGERLTWHNPAERRVCKLYVRRAANLDERSKWTEYFSWLQKKLETFAHVFGPIAREIGA
jgi:hypothetical protein